MLVIEMIAFEFFALLVIVHAVVNVVFALNAIEPIDKPNIEVVTTCVGHLVLVRGEHAISTRILRPRPLHHILGADLAQYYAVCCEHGRVTGP